MAKAVGRHGGIDEQEVYDVLRNERRYFVIQYLQESVGTVTVQELAETLAERETGESPPPRNIRQSAYTTLNQMHLPKLDEAGIVDYDSDRKTVALRTEARELDGYMEVATPFGITWAEYYRTLGVLGLLLVVLSEVSEVPFDVDPLLLSTGFLVLFVVSMSYQFWTWRWLYLQSLIG